MFQCVIAISRTESSDLMTLREITEIRRPCKLFFKRMMIVTVSGGWNVVIRKRKFKVGEHILFCKPDTFIPSTPPISADFHLGQ
ncbi:hypothetical protein INS49_007728 [Diaporthe citri]|uniref:uncharacterized protein n=1 Tax=Diaporthe citri TaxID=83186 RepID=UPI001C7F6C19|nr:uncharacterized protein INS49_007728 [Diaporthe citri]KAG6362636.1 hypothetical protein INS49_007728 [Diaporthe citri]